MHARVVDHRPTATFHTVSPRTRVNNAPNAEVGHNRSLKWLKLIKTRVPPPDRLELGTQEGDLGDEWRHQGVDRGRRSRPAADPVRGLCRRGGLAPAGRARRGTQ